MLATEQLGLSEYAAASEEVGRRGPTLRYFELLELAVRARSVDATYDLGMWLLEGRKARGKVVLEVTPKRAFTLLRAAGDRGHSGALRALADCLSEGTGCKRDLDAAARSYAAAARKGEAVAAYNLSTLFRDQGNRVRERYWLRRAVALGDPSAHLTLAEMDLERWPVGAARRARAYLQRQARVAAADTREEALEILEYFDRTAHRRWAPPGSVSSLRMNRPRSDPSGGRDVRGEVRRSSAKAKGRSRRRA